MPKLSQPIRSWYTLSLPPKNIRKPYGFSDVFRELGKGLFGTNGLMYFNPFHTNVLFIYPLKTSENLCFYYAFSGYRNGILGWNGLIQKELSHLTPFCNASKKVSEAKVRDLVFWLFQEEQKLIKMLQFAWCWKWNLETISLRSPHNIFSDFQGDLEKFLSLVFL